MGHEGPHHSHHHEHGRGAHEHGRSARGSLKLALIITAAFLVAEFAGALYTNSLALLADSGHMLTDVAALSLSFFAMWVSTKRATPQKTYGFYRVEILAALLNGVFLVLVALYVFYEAYDRFQKPQPVKADWMLIVASVGLLANIASAWLLFGRRHSNLNVRGAFFHVLSDAIGSAGAIVASIAIMMGYAAADPLISAVVAVLILSSSVILIRDAVDILLEGTPSHINIVSLREQLGRVNGVGSVHDLHVWTLTSGVLAMSCHVVMQNEPFNRTDVLTQVNGIARERFRIDHTTIQIEEANTREEVFDSCNCHFGAWDSPPSRSR